MNNAGIANIGKADTTTEEDFDKVMLVNVKGVYNCLYAAIPQLRNAGGGVIVNMASIAALVGLADRFAYTTAKGAVMAMTMSVAKDYINENIRCNSVSPARVQNGKKLRQKISIPVFSAMLSPMNLQEVVAIASQSTLIHP